MQSSDRELLATTLMGAVDALHRRITRIDQYDVLLLRVEELPASVLMALSAVCCLCFRASFFLSNVRLHHQCPWTVLTTIVRSLRAVFAQIELLVSRRWPESVSMVCHWLWGVRLLPRHTLIASCSSPGRSSFCASFALRYRSRAEF